MGNGFVKSPFSVRGKFATTVNSPLMDTLVSGQLYLRTPFQIPILPPSQTPYLHIPVSGHSLVIGRGSDTFENENWNFSFVYAL